MERNFNKGTEAMRTETTTRTLYTFDELSDEAKERAYQNWSPEYFWHDDNVKSLNAFCDALNIRLQSYSYGDRGSHVSADFNIDTNAEELTGLRLRTWIINNIFPNITKGKYYGKLSGTYPNMKHVKRYSRIQRDYDFALTGYCMDETLTRPLFEFVDKPTNGTTLEDILEDCLESWRIAAEKDFEYSQSFEAFAEHAEANEYEYTEEGDRA